ncbi:hypothetical protein QOT17_018636 [Balamuthia mandrillaris]
MSRREEESAPHEDEGEIKVEDEDEEGEHKTEESEAATSGEDKELDDLKRQVQQMQEEADRLEQIQKEVEAQMSGGAVGGTDASKSVDERSIYVGNVDYGTTPEELQAAFQSCGTINRVTILCDKFTGHPKGYAYVEFAEMEAVTNAMELNETMFRNRQIKVCPKRTNVPGVTRGGYRGRGAYRGRGGGFRGRGRRATYYHPYM